MSQHVTSNKAPLTGSSTSSVERILHHVDRLMTFHTVEWFLQERNKEAILKMNFTQDRNYPGKSQFNTMNSLPRVGDHIDRLSKSHRLREWDLRETDGRATIVVVFQYEEVRSQEELFFMTSEHLTFAEDLCSKSFFKTPKPNCQLEPVTLKDVGENGVRIPGQYNDECQNTAEVEPPDEASLPYATPLKVNQLNSRNTNPTELSTLRTENGSDINASVIRGEIAHRSLVESRGQCQSSPNDTSTKTKKGDMSNLSLNVKVPLKNKFSASNSTKGSTAAKGKTSTQNPFSVNGVAAATKPTTGGRMRARPTKPPLGGKLGSLQRSQSTSSIKLSVDAAREKHEASVPPNRPSNSKHVPKTGFSSSRFTFRKAYNKSKQESKDQNPPASVKRKTERLEDTDTEDLAIGTVTPTMPPSSSVKSTQTPHNHSHRFDSGATPSSSSRTNKAEVQRIARNLSARDKSGDAFTDLYRLYFADSADASMCNSDVLCLRQAYSQVPDNKLSNNHVRQYSSTPANKTDTGGMTFSAFGDLFRQYLPDSTDSPKCNLTSDISIDNTNFKTSHGNSKDLERDDVDDSRPRSSTSGFVESHSSDTESSVEDNPQETTLTEASRTSESSEAFSCCTEPCLEDAAKDEIQEYYLKIYNQIHRELRVETEQLVWQIDEAGNISLYHKGMKQTKVYNPLSPEELLELDQDGNTGVIPGAILQQYVFRRLLEELDQVTFDNRALTADEKKRLDRLMNKTVG